MSTVANVIDRLYREYLYPPSNQPSRARLNGALAIDATAIPLEVADGLLTPEEIDLLGEGIVIEIEQEWMLVTAWSSPNLTVVRGHQATTAATHDDGDLVYIAPDFTRSQVFNAVCDAVVDLYPDLYTVRTDYHPTEAAPSEVDSSAVAPHSYRYASTGSGDSRWVQIPDVEFLFDFPEVGSEVALQLPPGLPQGLAGWLTYFASFSRPTAETDDLTSSTGTWRMEEGWMKIIIADALATLIGSAPLDQATLDYITNILQAQGFPIRDAVSLQSALLRVRKEWISRASDRLRAKYPISTVSNKVVYT